jgi:hypothetical protein
MGAWDFPIWSGSTGVVTDSAQTFSHLFPGPARGLRLDLNRSAEDGTCTLSVAVNRIDVHGTAVALLDHAGNAVVFNDFADGETGRRWIVLHPEAEAADVDGVLAVGNNTYYRLFLPGELQVVVTTGGTAVSNTYVLTGTWLT